MPRRFASACALSSLVLFAEPCLHAQNAATAQAFGREDDITVLTLTFAVQEVAFA